MTKELAKELEARLRYSVYARYDSIGWDGFGGYATLKEAKRAVMALLSPSDASEEPATEAAIYDEKSERVRALYNTDGRGVFTLSALARSRPVIAWGVGAVWDRAEVQAEIPSEFWALETASNAAV